LQISKEQGQIQSSRLGAGGASLIIGCDFVTTASEKTLELGLKGKTRVVVNLHEQMTGGFTRNKNFQFPRHDLKKNIESRVGEDSVRYISATEIATQLMGNSIASNMFMLGFSYQEGLLPIGHEAINKAIELNGASVKMNQEAFMWGRRASVDMKAVERLVKLDEKHPDRDTPAESLDEIVAIRARFLTEYQNQRYAQKYTSFIAKALEIERSRPLVKGLAEIVARNYFKLLAYKDEYEVARLHSGAEFSKKIDAMFEGKYSVRYHLAPPLFSKRDKETGHLIKSEYGGWVRYLFKLIAKLKFLRGSPLDLFGWTAERKMERNLITEYEGIFAEVTSERYIDNISLVKEILAFPEEIRGFGHVKEDNVVAVKKKLDKLLTTLRSPDLYREAA
jgi:indolepyruvate ferredoxin oxidoreductase